tara:strand:- start:1022 stop:1204 length:183 start_codon:yes stop_codon:yes gene_type:complete
MAKIKTEDLRIKIIKPFYGYNNWRTKPIAIGKVLNYGNNPERAKELIRKEIAIEYKPKNV